MSAAQPASLPIQPTSDFVRQPAVSGRFYPADPAMLRRALDLLLREARPPGANPAAGIVVPHAAWPFSGHVAADAFSQARHRQVDVVVVLGANHATAGFKGIALFPGAGYRTPLGTLAVDRDVTAALIDADRGVVLDALPHQDEHSIEVTLPFVQALFPAARIVPVIVASDASSATRLGRALAQALDGRRALIVASSDLSHYAADEDAERTDRRTLDAIASLDAETLVLGERRVAERQTRQLVTTACGLLPVLTLLSAMRAMNEGGATVVSYANSADVALGEPGRVVGYAAVAFGGARAAPLPQGNGIVNDGADGTRGIVSSPQDMSVLPKLARETVTRFLESGTLPSLRGLDGVWPVSRRGVFVTIRKDGRLRGCVGRLSGDRPLPHLVSYVGLQAAFRDARFRPLANDEVKEVEFEVSLLSEPRPVSGPRDLVLGRDGVALRKDRREAVYLPYVATEHGWTRERLLDELCAKAGLSAGCWTGGAELLAFQTREIREADRQP